MSSALALVVTRATAPLGIQRMFRVIATSPTVARRGAASTAAQTARRSMVKSDALVLHSRCPCEMRASDARSAVQGCALRSDGTESRDESRVPTRRVVDFQSASATPHRTRTRETNDSRQVALARRAAHC